MAVVGSVAAQVLAAKQEAAWRDIGQEPPVFVLDDGALQRLARAGYTTLAPAFGIDAHAGMEWWINDVRAAYAERPTPYEEPISYSILRHLRRLLSMGMTYGQQTYRMNFDGFVQPLVGTIVHGEVNAVTFAVPGDIPFVVAFEREMINFASLFSKAIAYCYPYTDGQGFSMVDLDRIEEHIFADPLIPGRFANLLVEYAATGRPGAAAPYLAPPMVSSLASLLTTSMELFILAHEYAHIIADDLAPGNLARRNAMPVQDQMADIQSSELAADVVGAQLLGLTLEAGKLRYPEVGLLGAELYFAAMEMMDKMVSAIHGGDEHNYTIGTHPPSAARVGFLLEARAAHQVPLGSPDYSRALNFIVEILWRSTEWYLEESGVSKELKLAPQWTKKLVPANRTG